MVLGRIKVILLFLLNLVKRSLCCFRRRRKMSADAVPLTGVGVIPNSLPPQQQMTNQDLASWNQWEDKPSPPQTIEEHIQHYRNKVKQPELPPPQPDFFQDMEPEIKRQTKVILKPKEISSRLAFTDDVIVPSGESELESWEESEQRQSQWAEAEAWDADEILREKRKEDLRRKQMEREREHRRTLVSKLS